MVKRMVTVFKTNVTRITQARLLIAQLLQHFPGSRINVDLKDCDKVLRVETDRPDEEKIIALVRENGYSCALL
jgi:hypothetical protein